MKKKITILLLATCLLAASDLLAQCSSLYTTPEFPVATHPSDGHTQSWGCNLFTPTQFGTAPATLTGLQIYVDNSFGPTTYASQTIYMRHTATSSYASAAYPGVAGFTQCFTGTYSFPMSGLYTVNFNVANFSYDGVSNVEILFENRSNVYRANEPWFRRTPSYGAGVYRSRWNGNFGFGGFPGSGSDGSAVRLTYTLSLTATGGGGCGAILPMNLLRFAGEYRGEDVYLEWQSSGEDTEGTYTVQRSTDGAHFTTVVTRDFDFPLHESHEYSVTDHFPAQEQTFYRIARTDANGFTEYSQLILLRKIRAGENQIMAWPNPSPDKVTVELPYAATEGDDWMLVSADGRIMQKGFCPALQSRMIVSLAELCPGMYDVVVRCGGQVWSHKVVKQ